MTGTPVPPTAALDPAFETLEAGAPLVRIYDRHYSPDEFNPTAGSARFRPVYDSRGAIVPTAYGAHDPETAISEAVLRGVTALHTGIPRRRLYRLELEGLRLAVLRADRPLRLVRLHGAGLTRLGILRSDLIDSAESEYSYTAEWAQALYGLRERPHGLAWTSRQNDSARAFMLWGGHRVQRTWLRLDGDPIELDSDPGLDLVRAVCADAGVDVEA